MFRYFYYHEGGGHLYQINKIFNNNVILAFDSSGSECVLMGKGIGFSKSKDDSISSQNVQKVFRLSSKDMNRSWAEYLITLSEKQYQVTKEIIEYAEMYLKRNLDDYLYLSLTDHIEFALERKERALSITNPLSWEIKNVYPHEYRVGLEALDIIEAHYGQRLSHEEASSIALHIINASDDGVSVNDLQEDLKLIKEILDIISGHFDIDFEKPSLTFERFILHLKFFAWRTRTGERSHEDSQELYRITREKWPETADCISEIVKQLQKNRHIEVSDNEAFYLMVHINRLRLRDII